MRKMRIKCEKLRTECEKMRIKCEKMRTKCEKMRKKCEKMRTKCEIVEFRVPFDFLAFNSFRSHSIHFVCIFAFFVFYGSFVFFSHSAFIGQIYFQNASQSSPGVSQNHAVCFKIHYCEKFGLFGANTGGPELFAQQLLFT